MNKISTLLIKIKNFIKTHKVWSVVILILIIILVLIILPKNNSKNITTDTAKVIDLKQTVLATGQVTSEIDLNLSFNTSGLVRNIKIKTGDKVKKGQILANLEQGLQLANLTQARGVLAGAEARYKKVIEGSTNEELAISKTALSNAKRDYEKIKSQQEISVGNAYRTMLNSNVEALNISDNTGYDSPSISGTYSCEKKGTYYLESYGSQGGISVRYTGLEDGAVLMNDVYRPIGSCGLFISFDENKTITSGVKWEIQIPNKRASNYNLNYNAWQLALKTQESALSSAQSIVDQRQAELNLKLAGSRSSEIDLALADILSAKGGVESATANFENTVLRAPANGTITKIDMKIGEIAQALKEVMVLQDIDNFYLEANVNEANIANLKINSLVFITFDSFGSEQEFEGNIIEIEPGSTLVSGVVNYKIKASVINPPELRPGMTANMTILIDQKNSVLAIPSRAVINKDDNTKVVRVVTDSKTKKFIESEVETGLSGDGGLIEIISGLNEGEEVVTLIKK